MSELLAALGRADAQLYLAIVSARNAVIAPFALGLDALNYNGLFWYVTAYLAFRRFGSRRGVRAALTILVGLVVPWVAAELIKLVVQRPRPFLELPAVPETLQVHPASYSFPSGDAAFAVGAAVACAAVLPRLRPLVLLLGAAFAIDRVVVGVHYPLDVLGGASLGLAGGLAAPRIVASLWRELPWRVFVVAHTHWDREWYERFEGYRARLVPMVSKLLTLLERDERFRSFTFDGQTIALEDHLEKRPADRSRVEALVRAERLLVGPWYVLADLLLVSGESLLRNFQEGLRVSASFGRAMRVAYVADPFGHPAQMPQLLRGFGYTSYVFARGVGGEGEDLGSEFGWEAPSGDRVLAAHQVGHYSNALPLVGPDDEAPATLSRRVRRVLPRVVDRLTRYASGDALLFMVGDDHVDAYPRLAEAVDTVRAARPRLDVRIASLEEFVAALPRPRGVYAGEMIAGRYRPILRGVNSTRVWIKQENARCERLLLEHCEPLDALTGGTAEDELRALWRLLLQNHPHDSICGCSIDDVHDVDMAPRFARVRADGERLAARLLARLAGAGDTPLVFDPLPWPRDAVVQHGGTPVRVRGAGLGLAPLARVAGAPPTAPGPGVIENEHLRVEVDRDGSFVIVDRSTGERTGRQNALVDDGDRGDEYTFSYAGPTVDAAGLGGTLASAAVGDRASVTVDLVWPLPRGLRPDRFARSVERTDVGVRCVISLDAGARRVDVAVRIDNTARDHRLRAICETTTRASDHVAGAAFAWLRRPTRLPVTRGWIEPPTETQCAHELVAVRGATRGLAVGLDGIREYAVQRDGARIAITLVRAVGWLSRGDLRERRGHAGPALETPGAQCPGPVELRYCVVPLGGEVGVPEAARAIREYLSPPVVTQGTDAVRTYVRLEGDPTAQLSSLRAGRDGSLIARVHAPTSAAAEARLVLDRQIASAHAVDLREGDSALGNTGLDVIRTAAPPEVSGATLIARLEPYEVATFLIAGAEPPLSSQGENPSRPPSA